MNTWKQTLLALSATPGVGNRTIEKLIPHLAQSISSAQELSALLASLSDSIPRFRVPSTGDLKHGWDQAERTLNACEERGIQILTPPEGELPNSLVGIADPPHILFCEGDSSLLSYRKQVAVIGTRKPTDYGRKCAGKIAQELAERGWCIVSGLAEGIDTAGHEGALAAENGRTVAFLAHGLDMVYPAKNTDLAARIVDQGGALLSEYPPNTKLNRAAFVQRDRLQSGLSVGVIVIETGVKGGTMHTVGFCREQGRLLAAMVHRDEELRCLPKTAGNSLLVETYGAFPLAASGDLDRFESRMLDRLGGAQPGSSNTEQEQATAAQPTPALERSAEVTEGPPQLGQPKLPGITDAKAMVQLSPSQGTPSEEPISEAPVVSQESTSGTAEGVTEGSAAGSSASFTGGEGEEAETEREAVEDKVVSPPQPEAKADAPGSGKPVPNRESQSRRKEGRVIRIVSGGQTGADRGGLDAAIDVGVRHGGWCPKGRRAEDGMIPDRYRLLENESPDYVARTELNVIESHATVVFTHGKATGGSEKTIDSAREYSRPCLHVDLDEPDDELVARQILKWLSSGGLQTSGDPVPPNPILNVTGSRESKARGIQKRVEGIMKLVLG
ncbi:MAG: hypothetical protein HN976_36730 [Lentisphaerae bacterium]|nr:hypothetical protein [Lentisphaerota bacterium]